MTLHLRAAGDTALCNDDITEPLTSSRREVTCEECRKMTKAQRGGR